jgi:hypothetical protein
MTIQPSPETVFNNNINNIFEIASSLRTEGHGTNGWTTRVLIDLPDLQVKLIWLTADAYVPEHKVGGAITVQPVLGRVHLTAFGIGSAASEIDRALQEYEIGVGGLLSLNANVPHDVRALEDSCILISIVRSKSGKSSAKIAGVPQEMIVKAAELWGRRLPVSCCMLAALSTTPKAWTTASRPSTWLWPADALAARLWLRHDHRPGQRTGRARAGPEVRPTSR